MVGESRKNDARHESGQNEWHDIENQGAMAKARKDPKIVGAAAKLVVSPEKKKAVGY